MFSKNSFDKVLFFLIVAMVGGGMFIFGSASLGILASNEEKFYAILFNQYVLGLLFGAMALFLATFVPLNFWRKYSLFFFLAAAVLSLMVFLPAPIGVYHGGAHRWISVFGLSVQPAEFLKIGSLLFLAHILALGRHRVERPRFGLYPFLIVSGICAVILLIQPDSGTAIVLLTALVAQFFVAGARPRDIFLLFLIGLIACVILLFSRPYLMDRIMTFIDPSRDPYGSSYQIQQSLIAVGSGGIFGKGFGQSVQKFNYLPEPVGDSIFAVFAEEFGLIGALILIFLFIAFVFRGLRVARFSLDNFGRLLAVGIVTIIFAQAFMNIGSMLGLVPLTGVPLPFVSHGGTALVTALFLAGLLLNISKMKKSEIGG